MSGDLTLLGALSAAACCLWAVLRLLPIFFRPKTSIVLSANDACEIARAYTVTGSRSFPNCGRYIAPSKEDLIRFLENQPEFINHWIRWSEDKRWSPAWFFIDEDTGFRVGRTGPDGAIAQSILFHSPVEACADFIQKELDEERA
ncbi:MAG: hypothetical protein QM760_04300 [Nibricoccus sp.]